MKNLAGGRFSLPAREPDGERGQDLRASRSRAARRWWCRHSSAASSRPSRGSTPAPTAGPASVTVRDTALDVMGAKIHVHQSTVSYKRRTRSSTAPSRPTARAAAASRPRSRSAGRRATSTSSWRARLRRLGADRLRRGQGARRRRQRQRRRQPGRTSRPSTPRARWPASRSPRSSGSKSKKLFKFNAKIKDFLQHAAGGALPPSVKLSIGDDAAIDVEKKGAGLGAVTGKIAADRPSSRARRRWRAAISISASTAPPSAPRACPTFSSTDQALPDGRKNIVVDIATGLESGIAVVRRARRWPQGEVHQGSHPQAEGAAVRLRLADQLRPVAAGADKRGSSASSSTTAS